MGEKEMCTSCRSAGKKLQRRRNKANNKTKERGRNENQQGGRKKIKVVTNEGDKGNREQEAS